MEIVYASFIQLITDAHLWGLMLAAVAVGMIFGAVPGLGGKLGIVFSLPFVFGLDPVAGAVFLLAMHAVVHTGGAIPSILIGIPGSGPDAATVCDGFPMAQRGEAGRALGAALAASAVGGVIGAAVLALLMPVVRPAMLAFGPAELFFVALLGITLIGAISGRDFVKGWIVGLFGLMIAFVGAEAQTGVLRFTVGQPFLMSGVDLITAVLGVFAVPECIAMVSRQREATAPTTPAKPGFGELWSGVRDVARHWSLTWRTSVIGAVVGLVPGPGGSVASWLCYGYAAQTSKHPERFGKGAVEGVIGPEAANNSKEGGALLPTLFFGIPGTSGMAVMLGAFVMLGLQPGPAMARDHLDVVWVLIWTLVISNLVAAVMFLGVARWLAPVAQLRAGLLVPFVLLFASIGASLGGGPSSLFLLLVFGALGIGFKRSGWPRAPFVIGIVLGPIMETSLHQSLAIWGPAFVLRPLALGLATAIIVSIVVSVRRAPGPGQTRGEDSDRGSDVVMAAIMCAVLAAMVIAASAYAPAARLVPLVVGIPAVLLAGWQLARDARTRRRAANEPSPSLRLALQGAGTLAWLAGFLLLLAACGFTVGGTLAVVASQRFWLRESWRAALIGGAAAFLLLHVVMERLLRVALYTGWLGA